MNIDLLSPAEHVRVDAYRAMTEEQRQALGAYTVAREQYQAALQRKRDAFRATMDFSVTGAQADALEVAYDDASERCRSAGAVVFQAAARCLDIGIDRCFL